ncbi:MotA/TolQ/ExbB proton channel family protein [Nevskia ramosa]|uniref:MotA/TolQ/ExbB proton channel family protein n=1 Tax=Nevskia ramosa TaxID=64002 RepID=UPI003D145012
MSRISAVFVALLFGSVAVAHAQQPAGIDDLLKSIRESSAQNAKINQEREARFLRNKADQQAQLAQAEAELRIAEGKAAAVRSRYEGAQKAITDYKAQLTASSGDLGQVYAAVREAAAQFRAAAADSYVTAQFPERLKVLDQLADPNRLPSNQQLEDFWFLLMQEISENGKVMRFPAEVTAIDGLTTKQTVTRIGAFGAIHDGKYLVAQPGGGLVTPQRSEQSSSLAHALEEAKPEDGWLPVAIDPTRGNLLRLAALRPDVIERIHQGGAVGYVIIVLGLVGVGLALYQLWYLAIVGGRMSRQLGNLEAPQPDNPLGRVLACLKDDDRAHDPEVLETRVSEAVLRELPRIERFQSFLSMVVAAGPLLGLVGTVTGMIITFQVITEVGAGDPKVMAGGISQAMIATVLGLLIAIPILFINSVLGARSRVLVQVLDEQAAGLLARRLEARAVGAEEGAAP